MGHGAFGADVQSWQDYALAHSSALADGKMLANCAPNVRRRRYFAVVRPWAAIRGNILASCIPEGASDGKSASPWQHIAVMHSKRAGFGKICAPCIRKAPQTAFRGCTARRSCQGRALFAALTPRIMHGARILPSRRRRQTARAPQLQCLRHPRAP